MTYVLQRRSAPGLYVAAFDGEGRRAYTRDKSRAVRFGTRALAEDAAAGHDEDPEPLPSRPAGLLTIARRPR